MASRKVTLLVRKRQYLKHSMPFFLMVLHLRDYLHPIQVSPLLCGLVTTKKKLYIRFISTFFCRRKFGFKPDTDIRMRRMTLDCRFGCLKIMASYKKITVLIYRTGRRLISMTIWNCVMQPLAHEKIFHLKIWIIIPHCCSKAFRKFCSIHENY